MTYLFILSLTLLAAATVCAVFYRLMWRETGKRWAADCERYNARINELEDRLFLKNGLPTKTEPVEHKAHEPIAELTLGSERRDEQRKAMRAFATLPDGEERRNEQREKMRAADPNLALARLDEDKIVDYDSYGQYANLRIDGQRDTSKG